MDEEKKKTILEFINKHDLMVLSTVAPDNMPEAAVVEFVATDNFELVFDTFSTYRKYGNIKNNPNVAVVIGWDENITVQYEGIATELTSEDELKKYQAIYFSKNPDAQKWQKFAEIRYFKIVPKWARYRDGNTNPMNIFEVKL